MAPLVAFTICPCPLLVKADTVGIGFDLRTGFICAAPPRGGSRFYFAVEEPCDRARERSRVIRAVIAPPRASREDNASVLSC